MDTNRTVNNTPNVHGPVTSSEALDALEPSVLGANTFAATLGTFAVRCGPTQHDYWQGQDSESGKPFSDLLFCRQCGDVIRFELPREDTGG